VAGAGTRTPIGSVTAGMAIVLPPGSQVDLSLGLHFFVLVPWIISPLD